MSKPLQAVLTVWGVLLLSLFLTIDGKRRLKRGEWSRPDQRRFVFMLALATVVMFFVALLVTFDTQY